MTAAARHTEGTRRGASGAHTQKTGHNRRHTAATEHTTGSRSGGQAEGRQEGRNTDGRAPGEWWRRGTKRRHGSRERTGREQTDGKKYVIYLRERRREKTPLRLAKACKCVYIHIT